MERTARKGLCIIQKDSARWGTEYSVWYNDECAGTGLTKRRAKRLFNRLVKKIEARGYYEKEFLVESHE